jgi:hypothetical protein
MNGMGRNDSDQARLRRPRLTSVEAAKAEQLSPAEKYGIRVTFVRPPPQHEDDEDVANFRTLQSGNGSD